ncbi:hypothetical protein EV363DRAFT_1402453 [Boletus edulis]|nr:hypothetical protein EV363DRAFT_1402453 [Boletus edulis]
MRKTSFSQALIRDGYKCVVTGIYDAMAEVDNTTAMDGTVHTELAHILPESTCFNVSDTRTSSPEEKDYSASVLAVLQRFGYDIEKVNGPKVHSLYNVMTMQKDAHDAFDRLEMWFESTGVANRYRVQTTRRIHDVPCEVTFTSPDPLVLPFPSQELLALHAACAKVAHLSGASEYLDNLDRDADELDVLAADGSSFAVLTHAIVKSKARPVSTAA